MLRSGTQLPVALQPSWLLAWRTLAVGAFSLCWHQACVMALCVTPLPWLVKHVVGGRKPCSCHWNEHLCVRADDGRWGLEALLRDARGGSQICPAVAKRGRELRGLCPQFSEAQQVWSYWTEGDPSTYTSSKLLEWKKADLKSHIYCSVLSSHETHFLSP